MIDLGNLARRDEMVGIPWDAGGEGRNQKAGCECVGDKHSADKNDALTGDRSLDGGHAVVPSSAAGRPNPDLPG